MLNADLAHIYEQLKQELRLKRLVLLHPESTYRAILVTQLIHDVEHHTVYYNLQDTTSLQSFVEGFTRHLINLRSQSGQYLKSIKVGFYRKSPYEQYELLSIFMRELSEFSDAPYTIILDDYDYVDIADDLNAFIEQLASALPPHVTLLLNSRTLPRLSWLSLIAMNKACLFRDGDSLTKNIYGHLREDSPLLRVYAFGQNSIVLKGKTVDTWEGHLPRLVLFYALDKHRITRQELCRDFWPNADNESAVNVFHVTKRRLHKALQLDLLSHDDDYYIVNTKFSIYYDVIDFVETLSQARNLDNTFAIEMWQRVITLYRGKFLQGYQEPWILTKRHAFSQGFVDALSALGRLWVVRERYESALGLYERALEEDYLRQDIHRALLNTYLSMGRRNEAIAHVNALKTAYQAQNHEFDEDTLALIYTVQGIATP